MASKTCGIIDSHKEHSILKYSFKTNIIRWLTRVESANANPKPTLFSILGMYLQKQGYITIW